MRGTRSHKRKTIKKRGGEGKINSVGDMYNGMFARWNADSGRIKSYCCKYKKSSNSLSGGDNVGEDCTATNNGLCYPNRFKFRCFDSDKKPFLDEIKENEKDSCKYISSIASKIAKVPIAILDTAVKPFDYAGSMADKYIIKDREPIDYSQVRVNGGRSRKSSGIISSKKKKSTVQRKTRKELKAIELAVARAEGRQNLARFGHTGEDKFKEEMTEHAWLHDLGKPELQKMINKHYYKYDTKKVNVRIRQPATILYPKLKKTRRKR